MRRPVFCLVTEVILCSVALAQESGDTTAKDRQREARSLARSGSPAIAQLTPMIKDPDVEVRREAVRSLVQIGTGRSLDPLIEALRDNDAEVQIIATDGLVNFYLPGYIQSGLSRLGASVRSRFDRENTQVVEPYLSVREDVVVALGKIARGGASIPARANAARAIGVLRGKAAIEDLLEAMKSKDSTVIFEALIALQKINDPSAGPRIAWLLRDLDERVQIAAIETTGLLKATESVPELQKVYSQGRSDRVRRAALTALSMLASPASKSLFDAAFNDRNDQVRASAAEGYARLKDASARPQLDKAFETERKMAPRLAIAFALVSLGATEATEFSPLTYLVNTLNSRSYRNVAQPYLVEVSRDGAVRNALHGFLRSGTREEKIGILDVLARSGDAASIQYIKPMMQDTDLEVAQAAIRSMKTLQARLP